MERRLFLKIPASAAMGTLFSKMPVMAGPFVSADWDSYIPADKKLKPEWVNSLFARGEPTTYAKSRDELKFIGMPVGGICCGTLYLGGDGRLWCWDIFNQNLEGIFQTEATWAEVGLSFAGSEARRIRTRDGANFVKPPTWDRGPKIEQGFALRIREGDRIVEQRNLRADDWAEVTFTGQYPVGTVRYSDPASPLAVTLEAFSPFIPLNADDSGLPATVFHFTLTNHSGRALEADLGAWLQNATCFHSAKEGDGTRANATRQAANATLMEMRFEPAKLDNDSRRPDILVDDFEKGYDNWRIEGEAFGQAPASRAIVPPYQGDLGGEGGAVVNSHASAPGDDVTSKDAKTGRLTSKPFVIQRKFLTFYIGGGKNAETTGLRLLVGGQVVASASGRDENRMRLASLDVAKFEGQEAVLEIYDDGKAGWGNVGVDHIVQTDHPREEAPLEKRGDFGTMALAVLGQASGNAAAQAGDPFAQGEGRARQGSSEPLIGALTLALELAPGESKTASFIIAWCFPNNPLGCPDAVSGNYYAKRLPNAGEVAHYVAKNFERLKGDTLRWRDTWADSTLPHWFLERSFANLSTLATTTSHRFGTGRFWGWEGIGCCHGTCTHVWHYAQGIGRIFPEIERDLRERVDFGVSLDAKAGYIRHRAEGSGPAIDGHCGRILGVWREHQMSPDDAFLRRLWPKVRLATQHVLDHDKDGDGLIDGSQENTLDAAWFGQIAWISSLALAALRAGEEMAKLMGDAEFAARCRQRFEKGKAAIETALWNGEYFIHRPEPGRENNLGTYQGCHIDQVMGQSWAWQVGLGRVLDPEKTRQALAALWKYNFAPDVGPWRRKQREGRPYALAGDAGLVMSTNPQLLPKAFGVEAWQSGYFNECMSGFEHQAASHMVAEGLVQEGLAVTRAIHDRYHAAKRNPWNEIECSDHYARPMASYGTFVTACGFEIDCPRGHIGFTPRLSPENFRAPFTAAEGWGTFAQKIEKGRLAATITPRWGKLSLVSVGLQSAATKVEVKLGQETIPAKVVTEEGRVRVEWERRIEIRAGQALEISLS